MQRLHTLNSVYEIEGPCVRRVSGENETVLPVPDGEWIECERLTIGRLPAGPGVFAAILVGSFADETLFASSAILDVEEGVEAEVFPEVTE